jgi:hypothetical protein
MLLGHDDTKAPAEVVHATDDLERGPVRGRVFVVGLGGGPIAS